MQTEGVTFELQRGDQIFKNPVMVKAPNGGFRTIGYAKGLNTIDVDKHPSGIKYDFVYLPYNRFTATDPLLIEFLKNQQTFSEKPNNGRIWIHNAYEKAKRENDIRKIYIEAMNYIDSLEEEELNIKAFAKIGVSILGFTEEEIKQSLYNIADENPKEILDLKEDSTYDFIGKAIYNQVIELVKGDFYIYGERNNLLFQTPHGMNSKERFSDFLKTKEGKPVYSLIASKMPNLNDDLDVRDDVLTDVKGIGAGFEKGLLDAGIVSISQLSEYDEESLVAKLYNNGYVVPKIIKVQDIITRARLLKGSMSVKEKV